MNETGKIEYSKTELLSEENKIQRLTESERNARNAAVREVLGIEDDAKIDLNNAHNGYAYGVAVIVFDAARRFYQTEYAEIKAENKQLREENAALEAQIVSIEQNAKFYARQLEGIIREIGKESGKLIEENAKLRAVIAGRGRKAI